MKNFRTLTLATQFYHLAKGLKLKGDAKDQLLRAARSIALNLAEGRGRATVADQRRFFHISLGSLRECQTVLALEELTDSEAWRVLDNTGAHLHRLIQNAG